MIIGFTGTRSGMSERQKYDIFNYLKSIKTTERITVIHGGCTGADMDFHKICISMREKFLIEVYPGHFRNDPENKDFVGNYQDADIIHESQTHFKRNRDIVHRSDLIIAAPFNFIERGGTWYTINYAKKQKKVTEIYPR